MKKTNDGAYGNRELSWIEFNGRVLDLAGERTLPLIERLKFLAITSSNLDEFFMVRVGELRMLVDEGIGKKDRSGMTPRRQLEAVAQEVHAFTERQRRCFETLHGLLVHEGIRLLRPPDLSPEQARHAERTFTNELFPVISPIAVSSTLRFPMLSGAVIHLGVFRAPRRTGETARLAVIPVPKVLNRIIALPSKSGYDFLLLEDLIAMHVSHFFPGETIAECVAFRITLNAALKAEDELSADLLVEMAEIITKRRRSNCLRIEMQKKASPAMITFLLKGLRLGRDSLYFPGDVLDYTAFMRITQLPGLESLKYEPWPPVRLLSLKPGTTMFEAIGRHDIILNHPYDSFEPVVRFVEEAAGDPDTIAIKQTLYRTDKKSRVVAALARAAENGKYVTAIVELKARFDEERNIGWARELEDAGVQVIYGIKRFKTHAKVCLIIRKEQNGVRKYVHFGTGNYNEITAKQYTDISLLTCHEDLAADASSFFNILTGHTQPVQFRRIAAAPIDLRETVIAFIAAEAKAARQGRHAFIKAKLNSLVDAKIINALYDASQAGVTIALNVRGICCLRPGVKKLSKNISVTSVVDRFLEHSRIFWFHGNGAQKLFISSADWMPRNLDKRCELLVPVGDPRCRKRLMEIMDACLRDTTNSWELLPDGHYRRTVPDNRKKYRCQEELYRRACEAARRLLHARRTEFETHRPKNGH
jgi:polyphosphate kinase